VLLQEGPRFGGALRRSSTPAPPRGKSRCANSCVHGHLVEGVDVPRRTQGSSTKKCNESGCDKLVRACGLCSTHYNQQHLVARHAVVAFQCTVCGNTVRREARQGRRFVCSVKCRSSLSDHAGGSYSWAADAASRARSYGCAEVVTFDAETIFDRDNWTCYLCGQSVNRDADPLDSRAPAVHHVVSLGQGGAHTPANVRCACHGCSGRMSRRSH
jgi:endogenous inhibitor of DNA gyrase (YacG/DUF329 family)